MTNNFAAAFASAGVNVNAQPTSPGGVSALDSIQTGTRQVGARIVIAGQEKIGKTTLACGAPRALLIPLEMPGSAQSVAKTHQIERFDELKATLLDVKARAHGRERSRSNRSSLTAQPPPNVRRIKRRSKATRIIAGQSKGVEYGNRARRIRQGLSTANNCSAKFCRYATNSRFTAGSTYRMDCARLRVEDDRSGVRRVRRMGFAVAFAEEQQELRQTRNAYAMGRLCGLPT
jgi:hypothetical protein